MRIEYITGEEGFDVAPDGDRTAEVSEPVSDSPSTSPSHLSVSDQATGLSPS